MSERARSRRLQHRQQPNTGARRTGRGYEAGVIVVKADLLDSTTLAAAFAGAHGGFLVTNF